MSGKEYAEYLKATAEVRTPLIRETDLRIA
jgi:hypothetical protein